MKNRLADAGEDTLHLKVFLQSGRVDDPDRPAAGSLLPLSVAIVLIHTVLSYDLIVEAGHSSTEHSANQYYASAMAHKKSGEVSFIQSLKLCEVLSAVGCCRRRISHGPKQGNSTLFLLSF